MGEAHGLADVLERYRWGSSTLPNLEQYSITDLCNTGWHTVPYEAVGHRSFIDRLVLLSRNILCDGPVSGNSVASEDIFSIPIQRSEVLDAIMIGLTPTSMTAMSKNGFTSPFTIDEVDDALETSRLPYVKGLRVKTPIYDNLKDARALGFLEIDDWHMNRLAGDLGQRHVKWHMLEMKPGYRGRDVMDVF